MNIIVIDISIIYRFLADGVALASMGEDFLEIILLTYTAVMEKMLRGLRKYCMWFKINNL